MLSVLHVDAVVVGLLQLWSLGLGVELEGAGFGIEGRSWPGSGLGVRVRDLWFGVWCLVFGVWCLVFGVWC